MGSMKGIKLHHDINPMSHLQFLDDTLLMGLPMVREANDFKYALDTFMKALGTLINHSKSQMFFINTPISIIWNITRILGFQRGTLMLKYLSPPFLTRSFETSLGKTCWPKLKLK